jgi:dihydrofolate synthase/folylpolyglutamate synthase
LDGLANIKTLSGLRGRWEILSQAPFAVADTAHNEPGVKFTMGQISQRLKDDPTAKLHMVWGMVSDKDREKILRLLPVNAHYYFCKPDVIRGFDAQLLANEAKSLNLNGNHFDSVFNAYSAAMASAGAKDIVYVGGSTFVVGDLLKSLS